MAASWYKKRKEKGQRNSEGFESKKKKLENNNTAEARIRGSLTQL